MSEFNDDLQLDIYDENELDADFDLDMDEFDGTEPLVAGEDIVAYVQSEIAGDEGVLKELRDYAREAWTPILHPEVAKMIEVLVKGMKPKRILEIGTAIGYSSILYAQAAGKDALIDTIEIDSDTAFSAQETISKAGLSSQINIMIGDAMEVLPWLNDKYDLVFLDGPKGQYSRLLPECLRVLKTGGMLITDNIFYRGMVTCKESRIPRRRRLMVHRLREFISLLCNHEELDTSLLTMGDGVALSVKKEREVKGEDKND